MRGNTTRQIVQMLRDAGAAEVHMRISAPPIRYPCHYGIDMSTSEEMVAHDRTVEEIARGARLRLAGLPVARRASTRRSASTRETHCDACFTGEYPLERTDAANGKFALEQKAPRPGITPYGAVQLEGIHHITCITGDAPRNVDFYARVMGLRMVKKTVNQDQPTIYHLFYGDEEGSPGTT